MLGKTLFVGMAVLGCVLLISCTVPAADKDEVNIAGKYTCKGGNAEGGEYNGRVEITKKGDTFRVEWTIGTETYNGVGIRQGDILSVAYAAGGQPGVVSYKIEKGPKLVGKWAMIDGKGELQTETLTFQER